MERDDRSDRLDCLRLAVNDVEAPGDIVKRAKAYYDFVAGTENGLADPSLWPSSPFIPYSEIVVRYNVTTDRHEFVWNEEVYGLHNPTPKQIDDFVRSTTMSEIVSSKTADFGTVYRLRPL